ncbi:protein sidekick [Holotrichia oblita]|uniref:Protein sidekick n=1 Tax=Holotrichia oblita TaxID=644536 RepID=A0ACB9SX32_HOLOL|nr:protein sidekick [Holotrichia oblita]
MGKVTCTLCKEERKAISSQVQRLSVELKDPEDVIVAKGQSASLVCAIQATNGNVDLVWLYNGSKIPLNDTRWELLDNGTLYIPKVTGKRMNSVEGLYQCLVKNNVGSLLSNAAKLSVATLGKEFQEQPTNITIQEGRPIVLPCKIHSFPSGIVTWASNNRTLPQTARYVPLPSGALLITSTDSSDTGPYRCSVVNPILKNKARESDVGWLTVTPRPPHASDNFVTPPVFLPLGIRLNVTAPLGKDVKLYCVADGWPPPSLYWIKESSSTPLGNSSLLTLWNVTVETTGKYSCTAKNRVGVVNQTFNVEVHQPPYFNNTLDSKTYVPPITLRIPCHAFGIPKPKVYWLKNGEKLTYNARQRNHSSTLIISNSVTQDMGFYQCVAENRAGKAWIAAQYVPRDLIPATSPPLNVKCRPYNDTSICVYWKPSENVNTTAYVVYHFYAEADTEIDTVTQLTYQMLANLNRSTNYTFYVRAFTTRGSDQSEHIVCKTAQNNRKDKSMSALEYDLHAQNRILLVGMYRIGLITSILTTN